MSKYFRKESKGTSMSIKGEMPISLPTTLLACCIPHFSGGLLTRVIYLWGRKRTLSCFRVPHTITKAINMEPNLILPPKFRIMHWKKGEVHVSYIAGERNAA